MTLNALQCSAELIEKWAEESAAAGEAQELLLTKALELTYEDFDPRDADPALPGAIRTLIHAARFAGTTLHILPSCLLTEVRIAKKIGRPWSYA